MTPEAERKFDDGAAKALIALLAVFLLVVAGCMALVSEIAGV